MRILGETTTVADITSLVTVGHYTALENLTILAQILFDGIVGGDIYDVHLYVDDFLVVPERAIGIPATDKVLAQSRAVVLISGKTASVKVKGLAGDVSVTVTVRFIDTTPLMSDELTDAVTPALEDAIVESLKNVQLHPTKTVLGPCAQVPTAIPQNLSKRVVTPVPRDLGRCE